MNDSLYKQARRREGVPLRVKDWVELDVIAKETNSVNISGLRRGKPSWRSLLRRIAQRELVVISRQEFARLKGSQVVPVEPLPPAVPSPRHFIGPRRPVGRPLTSSLQR